MLSKTVTWSVLVYGLLIISLGYYGYREAQSTVSLWSGLGLGTLLLLSALLMSAGRFEGTFVALGLTLLLTGFFAYRYTVTHQSIPAILAVASGGMLLFLLARIAKWKAQ